MPHASAAAGQPFDLGALLIPVLPWWELLLRGLIVYVFLLFLIRLTGRRQAGMMTPFDFILLLILSNTVQNAMNGGDNSLGGGLFLAATLIAINWIMLLLSRHFRLVHWMLVGRPVFLVRDGAVQERVMQRERISHHELMLAMRAVGLTNIEQAKDVILETNGTISVIQRTPA
ncbi:MAG: hypothetical protein RL646_1454 [Verrucomicrobiota bacterium]|jgi:uncharacterized membrane protein YcaP (DUF421 family)